MSAKLWQDLQRCCSLSKAFLMNPSDLSCPWRSVTLVWRGCPHLCGESSTGTRALVGSGSGPFNWWWQKCGSGSSDREKKRQDKSCTHFSRYFFPLYDSKPSCKAGRKEGRREGRAAVCICHHCQQRMMEQVVPGGITSGLPKTCSRLPGKWYFSCNDFAFIRNKALPRALLPSGRWIAPLVSLMSRDGFNKMFCFKGKKTPYFLLIAVSISSSSWQAMAWDINCSL